ncbi:MAG: hypothetical protein LBK47_01050 [Prevotellaceae bacterium]|jgi:hypothetical protein|nr:hypothetical protein [Prevotellaceae bacterium]
MKNILVVLSFLMCFNVARSSTPTTNTVDMGIVEYLKKAQFNMLLVDLSFCVEEVKFILTTDSTYIPIWKERIERGFNNQSNFLRKLEYALFQKQAESYFVATSLLYNTLDVSKVQMTDQQYIQDFLNLIEYPDEVDHACVVLLLCVEKCEIFNVIAEDKAANRQFKKWFDYGFEEFRYYPGLSNSATIKINNRIIKHLKDRQTCQNKVVKEAFAMMEKVQKQYSAELKKKK